LPKPPSSTGNPGERTGGTCGFTFATYKALRKPPAFLPIQLRKLQVSSRPSLCHFERSEAQPRDLGFHFRTYKALRKNLLRSAHPTNKASGKQPPFPLSSRAKRSAAEGPAVPLSHLQGPPEKPPAFRPIRLIKLQVSSRPSLCHPERSEAQPRDLRFHFRHLEGPPEKPPAFLPIRLIKLQVSSRPSLCHPERSEA
jgi:hypothetical protein